MDYSNFQGLEHFFDEHVSSKNEIMDIFSSYDTMCDAEEKYTPYLIDYFLKNKKIYFSIPGLYSDIERRGYFTYLYVKYCTTDSETREKYARIIQKVNGSVINKYSYMDMKMNLEILRDTYEFMNNDIISEFMEIESYVPSHKCEGYIDLLTDLSFFLSVMIRVRFLYRLVYYLARNINTKENSFKVDFLRRYELTNSHPMYTLFQKNKLNFVTDYTKHEIENDIAKDVFDYLTTDGYDFESDFFKMKQFTESVYYQYECVRVTRYIFEEYRYIESCLIIIRYQDYIEKHDSKVESCDMELWEKYKRYHMNYVNCVPYKNSDIAYMLCYIYDYMINYSNAHKTDDSEDDEDYEDYDY